MPQPPTNNMQLVKPVENGDTGVWASLLDAIFDLIDAHDHTTGKGVKIPLASAATVNNDVSWASGASSYAITNLKAVDFKPVAASAASIYSAALFVNSTNNELTYRTTTGTNVQITSGTGLNIAGIGGIGGDYAGVGALVDFTDSSDTYAFRQQIGAGVRQYGHVAVGDLDLFEFKSNPTAGVPLTRVRHKSPAALAASYDLTWLPSLPGTQQLLQVDQTGAIAATNTIAQPITASSSLGVTGLLTTQSVQANGLLAASGGVTVGNNQQLKLQGTGYIQITGGTRPIVWAPLLNDVSTSVGTVGLTGGQSGIDISAGATTIWVRGPMLPPGARVVNVKIFLSASITLGNNAFGLYQTPVAGTGKAFVALGAVGSASGTLSTFQITGANATPNAGSQVFISYSNAASPAFTWIATQIEYDVP